MQFFIVLWWWVLVTAIGALASPLAFRLLRWVPDCGYSAARPLGLLLGTYIWWLLGSFGFLNTSLGSVVIALACVGGLSVWFYQEQRASQPAALIAWLRSNLAYVLTYEALLLMAFVGWAYFRAHSPGINHTEKPMEFAFLNAILRSPGFPPNDPWLSGYGISYYYMGYVVMALLTRLSGTAPGIAYNIAHALWFALSAAGAFGAAYNLVEKGRQGDKEQEARNKALVYGVLAAALLAVMGNLGGVLEAAHQNGVGSAEMWRWLDIAELNGPPSAGYGLTPQRGGWWWWRASRVINDYKLDGNSQHNDTTVIDEFPQFSFVLGDMHPHVLALPFALLAIALAFNLYQSDFRLLTSNFQLPNLARGIWKLKFEIVVLGALGFLNTWDYPIYLALVVAAYGLRRWQEEGKLDSQVLFEIAALSVGMGVAGFALYALFYLSYQPSVSGLFPNLFNGTRFSQFFVMFGPFLVMGACFIGALAWRKAGLWRDALMWTVLVFAVCLIVALAIGIISPEGRGYLTAWQQGRPLPGLAPGADDVVISRLVGRLTGASTLTPRADGKIVNVPGSSPLTPLVLTGTIVIAILLWRTTFSMSPPLHVSPSHFALLLFVTGAALALSAEFVFIGDAFGTRMNTVFKFYYQVWAMWSVAAGYGAYYVIDSIENTQGGLTRTLQAVVMAVLILAGLVYPLMAIPSRMGEASPTLDGTAYLQQENPDEYAAIQWLNANVPGAPVILESPGDSFQAQTSRVSGYTGLPTLLGWRGHESQWRKNFTQAAEREPDIQEIYNGRNAQQTLALLNKYNISYVYVGVRERTQYSPLGLSKFDTLLDKVFQQGSVVIYRVR